MFNNKVNLLHETQAVTGKEITETLKTALTRLGQLTVYDDLRKWRGKVKFSIDVDELRESR